MRLANASSAVDTHGCLVQMSSVMLVYPVRSSACFDIMVNAHLVHQAMILLFCFSADEDVICFSRVDCR